MTVSEYSLCDVSRVLASSDVWRELHTVQDNASFWTLAVIITTAACNVNDKKTYKY